MLENITKNDIIAELCKREDGFEYYIKYIQKEVYNYKPNLYPFQLEITAALKKVMTGEIKRLIINIPPRYRKTEIAVKDFISYSLALNPKARFIHLSYSDDLALDNSEQIKDIMLSEPYQAIFPTQLKKDSKSKKKWRTAQGGGVYATSAGGQVTGFGAGLSIEEYDGEENEDEDILSFLDDAVFDINLFGGAVVIDDPNKPEDAFSTTLIKRINDRFDSTIKNRVNSRHTPIIVIQQRVAKNDLSGYLLEQSDDWTLLKLPALNDEMEPLCEKFHTKAELLKLKEQNEKVFNNQYQQDPKPLEGLMYNIIKVDDIEAKGISIAVSDPAEDGKCYLATIFAYIHSNRVWVHDVIYTQDGSTDTKDDDGIVIKKGTITRNVELSKQYKVYSIFFEKNGLGNTYSKQVKNKFGLVQTFNTKGNKDDRIFDKSYVISKYFRFLKTSPNKEYERAMKNIQYYEKSGANDFKDFEDALTSLAEIAIKNNLINIYTE